MQIDSKSKIIYVHIPRTGGSWFTFGWPATIGESKIWCDGRKLVNKINGKDVPCGRHGRLSGIKEKLVELEYDFSDYKIITLVREPYDRIGSAWVLFSKIKQTAWRHGWKSIDDMLDDYESGSQKVHFLPQIYWLEESGAKWDHIFKFEDLLNSHESVQKYFPLFYKDKNNLITRQGRVRRNSLNKKQKQRIKLLYKDDFKYLSKFYE